MNLGFDIAVLFTFGRNKSSCMSELLFAFLMLSLSVLSYDFDNYGGDPDCLVIISLRRFCCSLS